MSKSLGNYVGIREAPLNQYSKIMSLADEQMRSYFLLCTDVAESEFDRLLQTVQNPMDAKHRLGEEIVAIYHGRDAAQTASTEWKRIHSKGEFPADAPEVSIPENPIGIVALVRLCFNYSSNGEIRRLIEQGGVTINGEKIDDASATVTIQDKDQFKAGKKNFAYLHVEA